MKIQTFLFIATLILCTTFVQDTEGAFGLLPSGKRELERKVCIPGIKKNARRVIHPLQVLLILFGIKTSTNILCSSNLLTNWKERFFLFVCFLFVCWFVFCTDLNQTYLQESVRFYFFSILGLYSLKKHSHKHELLKILLTCKMTPFGMFRAFCKDQHYLQLSKRLWLLTLIMDQTTS